MEKHCTVARVVAEELIEKSDGRRAAEKITSKKLAGKIRSKINGRKRTGWKVDVESRASLGPHDAGFDLRFPDHVAGFQSLNADLALL